MTAITIRHVPEDVSERIKARASREGQSVQQFLLRHLERIAEESPLEERLREVLGKAPKAELSQDEFRAAWEQARQERQG